MTKIILIEVHPLVRRTLSEVLEMQQDFYVIGEAADGLVGIQLVEALRPDVVIVTFGLPGLNGVQTARYILRLSPESAIIVFSIRDDPEYIAYALANGINCYISK